MGARLNSWVRASAALIIPTCLSACLFVVLTGCSVDTAKSRYILAEKLWNDGKYRAAVREFERTMQKDTRGRLRKQALFRAAMTEALYLNEFDSSLLRFKEYVEASGGAQAGAQKDDVWEALYQMGEILFSRTQRYQEAISHYGEMLKIRPADPSVFEFKYRIGKSHFYLREFDKAISVYSEILKEDGASSWAEKAALQIGQAYFTSGEQTPSGDEEASRPYRQAISTFEGFIKRYPNSDYVPEAKFGIASAYEELDLLDQAYEKFQEIEHVYPSPNVIKIKLTRIKDRKTLRNR